VTIPRHEYRVELNAIPPSLPPPAGSIVRVPSAEDADALADLMLDAYRGTIDYEDENLEDARSEVARYLAGSPMLDCSGVCVARDRVDSAALISLWRDRDCPIVSYVMTAADRKNQGLASLLLAHSLATLADEGYGEVRAVITEGNGP
jgi:GNAT superfamily N-acetyltransferase